MGDANLSSGHRLPMLEGVINIADFLGVGCSIPASNSSEESTESDIRFYFYLYKAVAPILFGIITVVGLLGNALVITVIVTKRTLRTRVNVLLLNLAICDVLFLVFCVPMTAYHFVSNDWDVGELACKLYKYLTHVTLNANMYILVAISVMRYVLVTRSKISNHGRSRVALGVTCAAIWICSVVGNLVVLDRYKIKYFKVCHLMPYRYCGLEEGEFWETMFLALFIFAYVVPLLLIALFYGLLVGYLRHENSLSSLPPESTQRLHKIAKLHKVSRLLLIVVLVFAISWLPLHIHFLISYFGTQPETRFYEVYRVLSHVLAYGNSCMNPIIYNYASEDFRKGFKSLMTRSHEYL